MIMPIKLSFDCGTSFKKARMMRTSLLLIHPFKVLVSPTFNIADLKPHFGEEDEIASRMTSIQEGEDDEDIPTVDTTVAPTPPHVPGSLTRAHACQLNIRYFRF
jgi:hypothetical protein